MPFDFFDSLNLLSDLLSVNFPSNSSSLKLERKNEISKKSKYRTEFWSASLLLVASIFCYIIFNDPLPQENLIQTISVGALIGFIISFILFFALYHLGLYYFTSIFKLLLFSCSVILLVTSFVLFIYFRSGIFL